MNTEYVHRLYMDIIGIVNCSLFYKSPLLQKNSSASALTQMT